MTLVAGLEEAFDCMLDMDDILDMSSYDRALDIMANRAWSMWSGAALRVRSQGDRGAQRRHKEVGRLVPRSGMNSHSTCGVGAFLGAGAMWLPKASLGDFTKLSSGSVLNETAAARFLMRGNPASGRQMIRVPTAEKGPQ